MQNHRLLTQSANLVDTFFENDYILILQSEDSGG